MLINIERHKKKDIIKIYQKKKKRDNKNIPKVFFLTNTDQGRTSLGA